MDSRRFDAVTRLLSAIPSRRALFGALLGGGISLAAHAESLAKKKGKRKGKGKGKKKKKSGGGATCPAGFDVCPTADSGCCPTGDTCCQAGSALNCCAPFEPVCCPSSNNGTQCCETTCCETDAQCNPGQTCSGSPGDGGCCF